MPAKKQKEDLEEEEERKKVLANAKKNAMLAYRKKQYEWASKWYSDAIELEDNNPQTYMMRSQCYYNVGRFEQSLADAKAIVRLRPRMGKGYYRQAVAHAKLEQFALAYRTVVKGLAVDPHNQLLLQTRCDVATALASGRWTNPNPAAMAFTYYDDSGANIVEGDIPRTSTEGASAEVIGSVADVGGFLQFARARNMEVSGAFYEKMGDGSLSTYTYRLRKFFDQDPARPYYFLYYSGRAVAETGDWCICKPRLGLADVLAMWKISAGCAATSRLVIIADCSFSGVWARELAENPVYADIRGVAVQASCSALERAAATKQGGVFTRAFLLNASLDIKREVMEVHGQPLVASGQQTVEGGTFASGETTRRVLLVSSWIPLFQALLKLPQQTPIAFAKWALPSEVAVHCGRRVCIVNVARARHIRKLHEMDEAVADDDEGIAADEERCHVS